jgi:[protein-PII] uridylyltransferase
MGFDADAVALVGLLVRRHLMLVDTATTRDPSDPATSRHLAHRLPDAEALSLLLALTEADARATSPKAWSAWRAGLVREVAARTAPLLGGPSTLEDSHEEVPVPTEVRRRGAVSIQVSAAGGGAGGVADGGARVTVLAPDRVGLLADAAALFALQRASVRSARAWSQGDIGVSVWHVADEDLDEAVLRNRLEAIVAGRVDPAARLGPGRSQVAPTVAVRPEASACSTVIEVRTADRLGVVHQVCAALAALDLTVRSAHIDTLGPQAVDVFYVQEAPVGMLSDTRAAEAAHFVRDALTGPMPLGQ